MTAPARWEAWRGAIPRRHSRRRFEPAPVPGAALDRVEAVCRDFRPFGPARCLLVREAPPDLFRGLVGSYGSVKGAPHCLVMVGPEEAAAEVGCVGEGVVLEAAALDLGTCWVAGLLDRERAGGLADLGPGERVFAVSPLGRAVERKTLEERLMAGVARSRRRRPPEAIAPGCGAWPVWARAGVEAARWAPSALNRQPWRFRREGAGVRLAVDGPDSHGIPKRLDCGIAMLHFELGARGEGQEGLWTLLDPPGVGFFEPG